MQFRELREYASAADGGSQANTSILESAGSKEKRPELDRLLAEATVGASMSS